VDPGLCATVVAIMGFAVAAGGGVPGQQASPVPPAAETRPAHRTATGRLATYDSTTRTLTLRSVSGSTSFHVAEDARVWLGRHRILAERLSQHVGAQATVAWAEVDGRRVTHTVRLAEGDPARSDGGRDER
jgi:hypothetical protein